MKMNTVLILCTKNEENTILDVINSSKKYVEDIVVIDGNSKDGTVSLIEKNNKNINIYFDNGKGKGDAIKLAIKKCKKNRVLVFMDADGSHEPNDIPKLIDKINEGYDLVVASRGTGGSDELSGSFEKCIRMIGSIIITMVINLRYKSNVTDSQNGFRAIRSDVAKKINLKENGFSIEQEMLMKVLKNKYKVAEISSHEYCRKCGKSNINLYVETWRYLFSLIKGIL